MSSLEARDTGRLLCWTAGIVTMLAAVYWFYYVIPVLFALIALRWHLLGGGLVVATALVGMGRLVQIGSDQWAVYLMLMPLLIGGMLHIMVGLRDRTRKHERLA
ncbi:MAG: hypothetical protein QUS33_05485 [Dehalococcoidia bacterium]|nr:hypothetical protein [Dehalococcoidia bacterium]